MTPDTEVTPDMSPQLEPNLLFIRVSDGKLVQLHIVDGPLCVDADEAVAIALRLIATAVEIDAPLALQRLRGV